MEGAPPLVEQPRAATATSEARRPGNLSVHVVANVSAGLLAGDRSDAIVASFARYPGVTLKIDSFEDGSGIRGAVWRALEDHADVVVAAGGDGTASAVAHHLMGQNADFGVLPMGTLNHFAKDLGISLALDEAVDAICAGETVMVDVAEVNGRHFLNNASIGAYTKAVKLRDQWRPFLGKWPAMILATIVVMARLPWFRVRIQWTGGMTRRFTPILFVGNNPYETMWPEVGRRPDLNRGALWLAFFKRIRFLGVLRAAFLALVGRLEDVEELEIVETEEIVVHSSRRVVSVALDGEIMKMAPPLIFRSHMGALRVRVPAAFPVDTAPVPALVGAVG